MSVRCNGLCCDPDSERGWPKQCLSCEIGLVHNYVHVMNLQSYNYRCDSCDRWRFKDDRAPLGVDDCLCVYDRYTPYPACPHDIRGHLGSPGPVGSQVI